jgi:hypothetical protein
MDQHGAAVLRSLQTDMNDARLRVDSVVILAVPLSVGTVFKASK